MKKILTLICAVALVSGANAQVKQINVDLGKPASQQEKASMPATAKAGEEDEVNLEALARALNSENRFRISYSCTGISRIPGTNDPDWDKYYSQPSMWSTIGSGWANCKYGSGEFGVSPDFTERSYYIYTLDRPYNEYGIVGAVVVIGRHKTTNDSINNLRMPLRFKLYSYPMGQVTAQKGYEDITSNQAFDRTVDCYFPADPDKFLCLSDTVGIPVMLPDEGSSARFGTAWVGARFPIPGIAGEHPCISIMFPRTGEGIDSLWNATLFEVLNDAGNNTYSSSKFPPMYAVYDFKYQTLWGNPELWKDRVDHEYADEGYTFIPNQEDQPNTRYAVVPMRSWNWTDDNYNPTDRQDGEIAMKLILAEGVTIERGASYDKYVEVKINPAIDHTVIAATDAIKSVEIYNLSGKLVKTQACNSNMETISLQGLNSGMYIAKVTTVAGVANKKIMVR